MFLVCRGTITARTCPKRAADSAPFLRSPIFACSRSLSRAAPHPSVPTPSLSPQPSDPHPQSIPAVRSLPLPRLETSSTFSKPPPLFLLLPSLDRTKTEKLPSPPLHTETKQTRTERTSEGSPRLRPPLARSDRRLRPGDRSKCCGNRAAAADDRGEPHSLRSARSPLFPRLFPGRFDGARVNLSSACSGARDFARSARISRLIFPILVRGDVSRDARGGSCAGARCGVGEIGV
jgi:hypothetical protein